MLGFFVLVFLLAPKANAQSSYWKNYFGSEERKAVQKNAEKYTREQIESKSTAWKGLIRSYNIKNGSITDEDISEEGISKDKISGLGDYIDQKISNSSTTQDFSADKLTGTYAALDGSQITGITASQVSAIPYSGATGAVDLNSKNLVNVGSVGIGTASPRTAMEINGTITIPDVIPGNINGVYVGNLPLIEMYQPAPSSVQAIGNNIFIAGAGNHTTTAVNNVNEGSYLLGIGIGALERNTTGGNNIAIGHGSQTSNTTGNNNMSLGMGTLAANTTGYYNTAMGDAALAHNTTGYANTAFGDGAGFGVETGADNVALGEEGLYKLASGSRNIGIGTHSIFENISGNDNVGVGAYTLTNNLGSDNLALGHSALQENVNGGRNIAIGTYSMYLSLGGSSNIGVGYGSLENVAGNYNTAIGYFSLINTTSGAENISIGHNAGLTNMTGSNNIFLGSHAGEYETESNTFYVDNQDRTDVAGNRTKSLMYGTFNSDPLLQALTINGNVGIGTTTPVAALDVNGQVKIQKSSSQPFACDATHDATIAVTSGYRTCICKGTTSTWVFTTDGMTACTW